MTMTDRLDRQKQRSYSSQDYSAQRPPVRAARGHAQQHGRLGVLPRRTERVLPRTGAQFPSAPVPERRLSHRGRRLRTNLKKVDPRTLRFVVLITLTLVAGIFVSMFLSGVTAHQTFALKDLKAQETTLSNQVETLNRDLASASSSSEIARRASEMKMVVPEQPGILATNSQGDTVEQRPAGDVTRPIVDVNGQRVRSNVPSSDPKKTDEVADELHAVPGTGNHNPASGYVGAPYAATAQSNEGGNE